MELFLHRTLGQLTYKWGGIYSAYWGRHQEWKKIFWDWVKTNLIFFYKTNHSYAEWLIFLTKYIYSVISYNFLYLCKNIAYLDIFYLLFAFGSRSGKFISNSTSSLLKLQVSLLLLLLLFLTLNRDKHEHLTAGRNFPGYVRNFDSASSSNCLRCPRLTSKK